MFLVVKVTTTGVVGLQLLGQFIHIVKHADKKRAKIYVIRKKTAKGSYTYKEFQEKIKLYDRCPQCNRKWEEIPYSKGSAKYKITKDHIIPLSQGGGNDINNIQPLCYRCNFTKGHSLI
jgi:5-methylcytosine-specific restriction endonuclease McrA